MEEQDYTLFENYLSGDLPLEDIQAFESRLVKDDAFKQAFIIYRDLSSHLQHQIGNEENTKDFRANLDTVSHRYFTKLDLEENPIEVKKTFNIYKLAVAASIALLMGFFVFNQFSGGPNYSGFNNHETIDLSVRGEEDNVGLLIKTTKAFNNKEYEKAKEYLEELLKDNPQNVEYNFYYAITSIELDNFDQADSILGTIANGNSAYKNKATWYWALSKLKQDKKDDCIEVLKLIPEDADDYNQALKLLKKLK